MSKESSGWNKKYPERVCAAARKWQQQNPERVRENARNWRHSWTAAQRKRYLAQQRAATFLRRYGITDEEYFRILAIQNGCCALCPRTPDQERYGRLNVDHCHKTNKIRGLLCTPCNHALGILGDNREGLTRALEYVS